MHSHKKLVAHLILGLVFSLALSAQADQLRDSLFAEVNKAMEEANANQANILAPVSYAKAADYFTSADERYRKKQNVDRIQKELAQATAFFRKSVESSELAKLTFESVIKARNDASNAQAEKMSAKEWAAAEKKFIDATKTLETSNIKRAREKADEAEKIYRDAELIAIKAAYLNKTKILIEKAREERVHRYAPKTLEHAEQLLAMAEKELSENRYDTDYPRSLVKQSFYQAKHSIYLADQVKKMRSDKISDEEMLLKIEAPVTEIASSLELVAEFDQGFDAPLEVIQNRIQALQKDSYELGELKTHAEYLEKEIAVLESKLGIQSERLARQEAQRERMRRLNSYFNRDEAMVLTQGNDVLIRVVGLTFDPGSALVKSGSYSLLNKLQQAIALYPDYGVLVEGHTDSFGGDAQNLNLSMKRSQAVREYFINNMAGFPINRSEAIGYGETRPIANNETPEGRERNRRIDLLLKAPAS